MESGQGSLHPGEAAAVLCGAEDEAVVIDALVALQTWVSETLLLFAVDEPGAESCLQACGALGYCTSSKLEGRYTEIVIRLQTSIETVEDTSSPFLGSGHDLV